MSDFFCEFRLLPTLSPKCIHMMAQFIGRHGDEVEADWAFTETSFVNVLIGRTSEMRDFFGVHRFFWNRTSTSPEFDFYKNENVAVVGNDVDLSSRGFESTRDNCVAEVQKKLCGLILSFAP